MYYEENKAKGCDGDQRESCFRLSEQRRPTKEKTTDGGLIDKKEPSK